MKKYKTLNFGDKIFYINKKNEIKNGVIFRFVPNTTNLEIYNSNNSNIVVPFQKVFSDKEKAEEFLENIEENKKLIKKYPILLPRNVFSGKRSPGYDYTYTYLDSLPDGWRISFGLKLIEDLQNIIDRTKATYFRLYEFKEKYGTLRISTTSYPKEMDRVFHYYEDYSMAVCQECGKPSAYVTKGWITFLCEDCFKKEKHSGFKLTWKDIPSREIHYGDGRKEKLGTEIDFKSIWPEK